MEKKYDPIALPVCLCGRTPVTANRVRNHESLYCMTNFEAVKADGVTVGYQLELMRRPLWLVGCICGTVGSGNTKRAAIADFERQVTIDAGT